MKKKLILLAVVIAGAAALCYKSGMCGRGEAAAE